LAQNVARAKVLMCRHRGNSALTARCTGQRNSTVCTSWLQPYQHPVLRVKRRIPITEGLLRVFNDLLSNEEDDLA
jgi:hypothetical protein